MQGNTNEKQCYTRIGKDRRGWLQCGVASLAVVDIASSVPRMALEAGLDCIAQNRNMEKEAFDARKNSPSQTGKQDRLSGTPKYGTVGIVAVTQAGLKLLLLYTNVKLQWS